MPHIYEILDFNNKYDSALVFNSIFSLLMYKRADEICKNYAIYYLITNLRNIITYGNCSLLNRTFIINVLTMIIKNIYFRPYRTYNITFKGLEELNLLVIDLKKKYNIK